MSVGQTEFNSLPKMNIEELKNAITELAKEHQLTDEDYLAEMIEEEAEDLIVAYCEHQGYLINGFPTEKRKLPEEELEEDYFCRERFQLYLDKLAIEKEDVLEICWHYNNAFWPDFLNTKEKFLDLMKEQIENGHDDFEL